MRLAVAVSHPIQYHAPLLRALAGRVDATVFYGHRASGDDQARAGFGVAFDWDVDLLSGYNSQFLRNVANAPGTHHFAGVDTPDVGARLAGGKFDALLVMGWHLKIYWQAVWAARRLGIPVMVRGDSQLGTPRSSMKQIAKRAVYPFLLRSFDAALYVGERSRAYYEHYNYLPQRLVFAPHCVDNAWFAGRATAEARAQLRARHGIAPQATVALFAGKLVPFKRPIDVIAAAAATAARAQNAGIEVMVAGSGVLEAQIRSQALDRKVPLHMLGFCNQSQMPLAYAAADVLVLPSDARETWGLVANEALACGRPIIVSSACGCAPDLAGDGTAGREFAVGDVGGLAAAINAMIEAPPSSQAIAAKARAYSVEAAVAGIVRAAELVRRRRGERA